MPRKRTVVAVIGALLALALGLEPAAMAGRGAASRSGPADEAAKQEHGRDRAVAAPSGTSESTADARHGAVIRLAAGAFDPLRGVPDVARSFRASRPEHWLVQVDAPASMSRRQALRAAGAEVLGYVPESTYLVRAPAAVAEAVRNLRSVRWVGPYHPAYKLSPALPRSGRAALDVWLHRGESAAAVADRLREIGGVGEARASGARLVRVVAAASSLAGLAGVESVEWIEPAPRYETHNANAVWVSDTGVRDELGVTRPDRLNGSGQVVAIADTGVNYLPVEAVPAHAAFADCAPRPADAGRVPGTGSAGGPGCLPADYVQGHPGSSAEALSSVVPTGVRHRKVAAYLAVAGDPLPRAGDPAWHGTHVAGTAGADYPDTAGLHGTRSRDGDGVAPAARLVVQDIEAAGLLVLPEDPFELFAQAYDLNRDGRYDPTEDARVHNNSYGQDPGLDGTGRAARVDDFVAEHPDSVLVFSASNYGPARATLPGGEQLAKNAIVTCASNNGRQPMAAPDSAANFSAHGPTPDGRLKPDLCAPGQVVLSPRGGTFDDDHYLQGTSMASPVVAGLATLVRQYFWDGWGPAGGTGFAPGFPEPGRRHNPSAALVKAVMIASAQRMRGFFTGDDGNSRTEDGQWPSAGQGFGRLQLDESLYFPGDRRNLFVADRDRAGGIDAGEAAEFTLDVAPGAPLVVTLAWTDPSSSLATGTPMLVNDLDLQVTAPDGTVFAGNEFTTQSPLLGPGGDPAAEVWESRAGGTPDRTNNVESVRLADPAAGRYTVRVVGAAVPLGPQGFGLVANGRLATEEPRVSFDVAKIHPGAATTAYLLGTTLSGETIAGFTRLAPSVYRRRVSAAPGDDAVTIRAEVGTSTAEATLPVDGRPPEVSGVEVESVSSDLAVVRWATDEPSTGEVAVATPEGLRRVPDVHAVAALPGLATTGFETKGTFLDRPVLSTRHEVVLTGLAGGVSYTYEIRAADEAGNGATTPAAAFRSTAAVYAPRAPDIAQLRSADPDSGLPVLGPEQEWGTSPQLFAGRLMAPDLPAPPLPAPAPGRDDRPRRAVTLMPAFMFRLPDTLDAGRITGASVQLYSGHDLVSARDRPVYALDLLGSDVEEGWGPGTSYERVDAAPADVRLVPQPTLHRGGNVAYTFAVACNDLATLRANLAVDGDGRRALAFRLRGLSEPPADSALSFEPGFGRRSRGPQLRPRLVLHLDGADPLPCRPDEPAPTITSILVDRVDDHSAVVSWRTDVPADSTVYFREAGTAGWTPVSSPVRVTQHIVRVGGLRRLAAYEFVVRSATCGGRATVDDNGGQAYALLAEAYRAPLITGVFAEPAAGERIVGWTTDQPATSVVRYGLRPDRLDREAGAAARVTEHRVTVPPLAPCRVHYFVVESTNEAGKTARSDVLAYSPPPGEPVALATFDFSDGAQGWQLSPPEGNGGLSAPGPANDVAPGMAGAPGGATRWRHRPEPAFDGSAAMRTVLAEQAPGYSAEADVRLVSPAFDLPARGATLRFREWFRLESGDGAVVEIDAGDGSPWVTLRQPGASANEGFPQPAVVEVPIVATGASPIRIAFRLVSDDAGEVPGGGWAVDDVEIFAASCGEVEPAAVPLAPASPSSARSAEERRSPAGPRPPVSADASGTGPLPPPAPPGPASITAGTAACGPDAADAKTAAPVRERGPEPAPAPPAAPELPAVPPPQRAANRSSGATRRAARRPGA